MQPSRRIAVIGAGVIGLSTAYNILDAVPGVEVTIFYESSSPNTTSDVAAGIWTPHLCLNTPAERLMRWATETWRHLSMLAHSELAVETGTFFASGRFVHRQRVDDPIWKEVVIGYRKLTEEELRTYGDAYKDGYFYTTVVCHSASYLPWLAERIRSKGGRIQRKKVCSFAELADFDVVVNCAGNGARDLCGDASLRSIRGHVIRGKAPWIKHFVIAPDDDLHVLCSPDGIVMGMTYRDDDDPKPKQADRERILRGCARLVPSVVKATELRDWIGFRPVRDAVRLEVEQLSVPGGTLAVVHNYGHASSGVTFHWGCAREAAAMVGQLVGRKGKL
ncbi:hypothetical protein LSH36_366g04045 [Paralvinella palmiformis]|uniref:FAD dependent oxidoreductase domain-containing protein n=1 Tax=Paralvinella palmiformis TaxID=53620 RepID=A0AAD9MZN6_9ANNE|nr:hypothetical protein LSH36_366g04045 [Paralvinella palmiformis]